MRRQINDASAQIPGVDINVFEVSTQPDLHKNVERFSARFYPARHLVYMDQVHGSHIENANILKEDTLLPKTDGVISRSKKNVLAAFSADCLVISFFCKKTGSVGICHAGHKGITRGVIEKTVYALRDSGAHVAALKVYISPHIGKCCYNIVKSTDGRIETFRARFGNDIFEERGGGLYLDLSLAAQKALHVLGVLPENIFTSSICTACASEKLSSHYRSSYLENVPRKTTLITTIQRNA